MATLQEYMARRQMQGRSTSGLFGQSSQGKYWWEREREDEDVLTAARRAGLYGSISNSAAAREKDEAGFWEKTWETGVDVVGNILSGAVKALEGVVDLGIGAVGAIGGIFDKGVRDEMRRWVEYDFTGENISSHFDRWSDDSIMNGSRAGRVVEGVIGGVGQLLPTVALSLATGGAALPSMLSVGASAAGNATEEAFQDGADYYRGMGYGVVSGGVEMATEKLFGGLGNLMGGGMLDNVTRSVAKTGAARVVKEAVQEGAEEALAEVVNPLAKSIYKGRDALSAYGERDYWSGVSESALVGGLTSMAYGGTVGRLTKTSGKYADVQAVKDEIEAIERKRENLDSRGRFSAKVEADLSRAERANLNALESILKKSSDKKRANLIKRGRLENLFESDGSIKESVIKRLDGAENSGASVFKREYYSQSLRGQEDMIERDLEAIGEKTGVEVKVFSGELSETAQKNFVKTKRALAALNRAGGNDVSLVITEANDKHNGSLVRNRTMYIGADQLESGAWAKTLVHEFTHFEEGTVEYSKMLDFLSSDEVTVDDGKGGRVILRERAEAALKNKGYGIDFDVVHKALEKAKAGEKLTDEEAKAVHFYSTESTAIESEMLLGNEDFIDRIVREDGGFAEKIVSRVLSLDKAFAKLGDQEARAQHKIVRQAERLYLKAAEAAGNGSIQKMILSQVPELEEEVQFSFEDGKNEADQELVDFYNAVLSMQDNNAKNKRKKRIGTVSEAHAALVSEVIKKETGKEIDLSDYEVWIDGGAVNHIEERHGKEGKADHSMADEQNIARIPWAMDGATDAEVLKKTDGSLDLDYNYKNSDGTPSIKVRVNRAVDNGLIFIAECVPDATTKQIHILSAYIQKSDKGQELTREAGGSPQPTSETVLDSNVANNSIAQNSEKSTETAKKVSEDGVSVQLSLKDSANQQTSEDIDEVRELSLQDLYDMDAEDFDVADAPSVSVTVNDWSGVEEDATEKPEGDGVVYRYSDVKEELKEAGGIALPLESSEKNIDELSLDELEDVIAVIRQYPYKLSKAQKERGALQHGTYNEFRKKLFGRTDMRGTKRKNIPMLKMIWPELSNRFPNIFDGKISVKNMGVELANVIERLYEKRDIHGIAKQKQQLRQEKKKIIDTANEKVKAAEARADERDGRTKLGEGISAKVKEMADARQGKFMAVAEYKSDILRTSIESLAQVNYGKTVSGSVRGIIKKLAEWYTMGNPLLTEEFGFDQEIALQMDEIALGEEDVELSYAEMKMLDNIMGHMLYMEKHYQKIRKGGQVVDTMEYAKKYVEKLEAAGKDATGLIKVLLRGRYMRQFGDPLALVKAADAYDPQGFFTETYREFRQAAVDMAVREMELMEDWRSFHDTHKGFDKRMIKDTVEFRGQDMRLGEAISLYMTLQRKQAQRGLVESYYVTVDDKGNKTNVKGFEPRPTGAKGKLTDAEIAAICKKGQATLWEKFDGVTREYVKMIEDTFKEMRSIKQATDMEMQGYTVVSDKGYYYPIRRDQVAKEVKERKFEVDRVSHLSINRATVEGANAGLLIEPVEVVFRRHIKSIALYSCFSIPMENYNRLVNLDVGGNVKDPVSIKRLAENTVEMKDMMKYMDKLAEDIQGSEDNGHSEQSLMRDTVEYLRGAYAKYQLGLNPKTVVTQLSSLFAASSRLDYVSLMKGFAVDAKDVDKYCRLAEVRNTENSAALAAGVLETTGKIGDKLMFGIGKMDRFVVKRLFAACQVQVAKEQKLKLGSEANKIAAGELLQEVILDTQQNALATERSDAMRSADTLKKSLTMFSADSMKVFGRFTEDIGEVSVLSRKLKNAKTEGEKKTIAAQLKEARKNLKRSAGALIASAAYMALVAQLFRSLYAKDDDKEIEEIAGHVALDAVANMVSGLPIINDSLSYIIDGYEVDNFIFAMYNDVLKAGTQAVSLAGDVVSGKDVESQEFARTTRDTIYAVAQLFGIPVRNAYNFVTGLSSRFSKQARYWNENLYYKQTYASDLEAAIEAEDENMISLIASMMVEDKVGEVDSELALGLRELVEQGHDVLPRVLGDSITYDGEEIVLTRSQRERFKEVYGIAREQIVSMMQLRQFERASVEVRARAIRRIWSTYWDLAVDDVLGVDSSEKDVLFAEAIDMDKLALIAATAQEIKADVNEEGKAISGTRLRKIEAFVEGLKLKAAQKYMIMGYLGYKNKNGEDKVRAYVGGLSKLSAAEREKLMEYAGYGSR